MPRYLDRPADALRPVRMTRGFTRHAEGSVLVEFGETRVLCTASVEEKVPSFLKGKTAPLASAPPSFSLPEGSVVRARGHQGEWVNVTHGQLSGWIRRGDCAPVLLAAAPEQ